MGKSLQSLQPCFRVGNSYNAIGAKSIIDKDSSNGLGSILDELLLSSCYATNEGSYKYGYENGSLKSPQIAPGVNENTELGNLCAISPSSTLSNGIVMPAVTNTTACIDGFFNGWKNWCINHAFDCIQNFTIGDFPDMIVSAHEQYLAGAKAANDSGNSMCPIGQNAAFCRGWDNNNYDYGGQDCGDAYINYTGPFDNLIGCPLDWIDSHQMATPHVLIGTWNYLNGTYSGIIKYSKYGNFTRQMHIDKT